MRRDLPLNLSICLLSVVLYTPILVLYLSGNAGNFTVASLAWPVAWCLLALLVPYLLWRQWPNAVDTVDSLLMAPALYILGATTFLPLSGGFLDGTERTVPTAARAVRLALMALCLLIVGAAMVAPDFRRTLKRFVRYFGLFAAAASVYMAAAVLPLRGGAPDQTRYTAALGTKQNVIVVLLDMLEGNFASEYFRQHPAAEKDFDGFVFYRNAASFAPFTALSYAGFMSGGYPADDQVRSGSIRDTIYYKGNIVDDMAAAGYATRYFSIITYENGNQNVVRIPGDIGLARKSSFLYFALAVRGRYLAYSYLPFGLKYMPWTQLEFGWFSKTDARDSFKWFWQHVDTDRKLEKGFLWFHSLLTHQPIRFDADGRFSLNVKPDDAGGEVAYAFSLLEQMVARLEKVGAYDNSLVIIMADHGYNILDRMKTMPAGGDYSLTPFGSGILVGQYNPLLMVKRPGAHGPLSYDDTAVSLVDLRKSLREFTAPGSGAKLEGFNFLGDEHGSTVRSVPVVRFAGRTFEVKDFLELENWRRDSLRLPLAVNYPHGSDESEPPSGHVAPPAPR